MTLPTTHDHVFLIRTPTGADDAYSAPLSSLFGRAPTHLSLLTTAFPTTDHLATLLAAPTPHQAVVITSARSIHALQAALDRLTASSRGPDPAWAGVDWFVVGRPTRDALLNLGGRSDQAEKRPLVLEPQVFGQDTGCADNLGPFIVRHLAARAAERATPASAPVVEPIATHPTLDSASPSSSSPPPPAKLLYLTGDKNRDTLDHHLAAGSGQDGCPVLHVERVRAYETAVAADFPARFESALAPLVASPAPTLVNPPAELRRLWIVLFSPSGAAAVLPELRRLGLLPPPPTGIEAAGSGTTPPRALLDIRLVAIGPTTRNFLAGEEGVSCAAMAATPDPDGVREAIRAAAEDEQRSRLAPASRRAEVEGGRL